MNLKIAWLTLGVRLVGESIVDQQCIEQVVPGKRVVQIYVQDAFDAVNSIKQCVFMDEQLLRCSDSTAVVH